MFKSYQYIPFVLVFIVLNVNEVKALRIIDFYDDASVGQWIELKSDDGLITKTEVISKSNEILFLNIQSFHEGKLISDSDQEINIRTGKVVSIIIRDEHGVQEIDPTDADFNELFDIEFEYEDDETIDLAQGTFQCQIYRAIYQDRLIRVWITEEIPLLHLALLKMQSRSIQILKYGQKK